MKKAPIGLYLHIPFCRSKCPYCDFCSFPRPSREMMEAYAHELARRIREAGDDYAEVLHTSEGTMSAPREVDTVYFGGGTPTLLPEGSIRELFDAIYAAFAVLPDAEITVEGNPAAASREALAVWRSCGVNRLSLGSQSAQPEELKALGRLHRWEDVEQTVSDARSLGIENVNLDFMLGIPHQTPETLARTSPADSSSVVKRSFIFFGSSGISSIFSILASCFSLDLIVTKLCSLLHLR